MQIVVGEDSGILHSGIEDCETMRMASGELRIATACAWFRHTSSPELRINIAAARAVNREFEYKFCLNFRGRRRGGCAPHTPLLSRGRRRSAPLAAAVGRFLATEPLARGSCAAWGRTFSQKSDFVWKEPLVPGSFAAWG